MKSSKHFAGHLAALITITIWGITFISTKALLVDFSAVEITFFRLVLAVAVLSIVSPPHGWLSRAALPHEVRYMLAGLCGVMLYFLFQNLALTYTLAANVSVLISSAPLFIALVSRVVLNDKLKAHFFLGFSIAMAGIILIAFNGSVVLKLNPLGDLLSLLAALVWAFYSVIIRQISARQNSSTLAMTRKVFTYGLLLTLPTLPLFDFRLGAERLANLPNLLNLLFLGAGGSALCYASWNYAVQRLGPVKTSAYIYLVPLVTILAAALILHEPITLAAGLGMALILAGMALSER